MKKLLSIVLLSSVFNVVHSDDKPNHTNAYFLKDGDKFLFCYETKDGSEKCAHFDIDRNKAITELIKENEKKANELIANIVRAEVQYLFMNLETQTRLEKREKSSTPEERKLAEEEIEKLIFNDENQCLKPKALREFEQQGLNSEYIKSLLSEYDLEMITQVEKMVQEITSKNQ